jgi:AraC family transcriptional regulator, regulatory protein of adaptative response / methylated-DNA-[protein]-cysteine methyltransferase
MSIGYTVVDSPLGKLLVAATTRGVCAVAMGASDAELAKALSREYPAATIAPDAGGLSRWTRQIVAHLEGRAPRLDLPLDVQATAFQWQVWQALAAIPYGETRTYGEIADAIGRPRAVRAVARACATNPVALAIPCHRVVPAAGGTGGYRWGAARKKVLLGREGQARRNKRDGQERRNRRDGQERRDRQDG